MHQDNIDREYLGMRSRGVSSKTFVEDLHERGFTLEDSVELLCRLFALPRGAATLFVASHPAWAAEASRDHLASRV
jgi:hypothetical protein